jgi:hypothetical protein
MAAASVLLGDGFGPNIALICAALVVLVGTACVYHWNVQLRGSDFGSAIISFTACAYFLSITWPFAEARLYRMDVAAFASLMEPGNKLAPAPARPLTTR